ncbi:MAG TPA: hypothetical protein VJR26_09015 [Candidatus Acidoferrales bacterium]|nr:hypothetical protein [Candidatus Acidoferrales bacterium]
MSRTRARSQKHFVLDAVKIRRAKQLLRGETETEAIERPLDFVISEYERNRSAEASGRLLGGGMEIKGVYGLLAE